MILGIDTSTAATAVALFDDAHAVEARDDPQAGAHPGHATRLLDLADRLLDEQGASWSEVSLVAFGAGPGGFTGLRVGAATAHGLATSLGIRAAGVSSLLALAAEALVAHPADSVLAVTDARRREVFSALYGRTQTGAPAPLGPPRADSPGDLAPARPGTLAVGDGAVRYRELLAAAGFDVPPADSPLHLVRATAVCRLAATGAAGEALPDYVRRPDAEVQVAAR